MVSLNVGLDVEIVGNLEVVVLNGISSAYPSGVAQWLRASSLWEFRPKHRSQARGFLCWCHRLLL